MKNSTQNSAKLQLQQKNIKFPSSVSFPPQKKQGKQKKTAKTGRNNHKT